MVKKEISKIVRIQKVVKVDEPKLGCNGFMFWCTIIV